MGNGVWISGGLETFWKFYSSIWDFWGILYIGGCWFNASDREVGGAPISIAFSVFRCKTISMLFSVFRSRVFLDCFLVFQIWWLFCSVTMGARVFHGFLFWCVSPCLAFSGAFQCGGAEFSPRSRSRFRDVRGCPRYSYAYEVAPCLKRRSVLSRCNHLHPVL